MIMKNRSSFYLLAISFVSTIGGFLFGYDTAIISGCNSFLESQYNLTASMLGWVVSSALLGTILGCIISGKVTDKYGRKKALILAASCLTVSAFGSMLPPQFLGNPDASFWLTSSLDSSFLTLIVVRIIGGIGVGITSVVAPIYISELTMPEKRGKMVSLYQLSITLGILLAFLVDWIVLNQAGDKAGIISGADVGFWDWLFVEELWRGMFGTEIPIAILFLVLLMFVPESPRWQVVNGKEKEALATMSRLGNLEMAKTQLAEMKEATVQETQGLKELFKPYLRRPFLIGILLPMFSHLSGIAAIMYFAPNILNESFKSVESSFLGAVLVGLVNSIFTFVAILNIERYGRRKLLLIGVIGAAISLMGVGVLFAMGSNLVIIPLLIYVACFAFSYGPIVWVIISEIFPTKIRGLAVSIGSLSLMVTGFFITLTNPLFIETINPSGTFFLYGALTIPAIWFIWKFVPETKGKTLEEIEMSWKTANKKQKTIK
ncbi:SP family arabinose:H+ symporter-like MFS transporter [Maribacter polysiphoniae]|uniref:SP family arabinose:H+ symporter-like MFS transporter n=2 Tax=Maribacter polysiphoniae TaxID=429344 RepID=A0A316E631_9FLAO|nr:SP family arabinose:H+ symporter-like MFS transporter [Maribacter polysiphoniae]